jgi:hypothetical protein
MRAPMQCFQNALAYFATTKSHEHKMCMELTPMANFIKTFFQRNLCRKSQLAISFD